MEVQTAARRLDHRRDKHLVATEVLWRRFVDHHNSLDLLHIHLDSDCNTRHPVLDRTRGFVGCRIEVVVESDSGIADCRLQHRDLLGCCRPIPCRRMVAGLSCDAVGLKDS